MMLTSSRGERGRIEARGNNKGRNSPIMQRAQWLTGFNGKVRLGQLITGQQKSENKVRWEWKSGK